MSKFEVGDTVERVSGTWAGMKRGDRGRVQSIPHPHGVSLDGWSGTHDVENLALVISGQPSVPTAVVPAHYAFPGGVRVHQISGHLTSFGGQALQYIARSTRLDGQNKGDTAENLRKAIRFLELEIERIEA